MQTLTGTASLALAVVAAIVLQATVHDSGLAAVIAGFLLVCCGTLLITRISHSAAALHVARDVVMALRSDRKASDDRELPYQWFLRAANFFRYGNIRPAEDAARQISRPVLRRGTQLVLDGLKRQQVAISLQRQIADERERLTAPVELLRAMAGYAPTLGMLGTLLGLVQMLFGVGTGDMAAMGAAMGFAMVTTVYGLVVANLLLKPLAAKVEQRNRRELTQSLIDMQAVLLLHDRQHPEFILEVLHGRADVPMGPRLATAGGVRV